jgi:hypothetical protein
VALPAAVAALVSGWLGCKGKFDGPYPCKDGFASCTTPDSCETDILHDGANCGGCAQPGSPLYKCDLGAPCLSGACGTAALKIASLPSNQGNFGNGLILRVNSTSLFWLLNNGNPGSSQGLWAYPLAGGLPQPIFQWNNGQPNSWSLQCNAYAVDDAYAYFVGQQQSMTGPPLQGLAKLSLTSPGATPTWLSTPLPQNGTPTQCPNAMAVDANSVYLLSDYFPNGGGGSNQMSTMTLDAVSLTTGMTTTISSSMGYGGFSAFALAGMSILFTPPATQPNQPNQLASVPVSGGSQTFLDTQVAQQNFGWNTLAADGANAYLAGTYCPCGGGNNNNGPGYTGPPQGGVTKIPLDGSPGTLLSPITGYVGAMTVDATNVYVLTDTSVWEVPIAGGSATPIAGNLTNGSPGVSCQPYNCNNGNYGQSGLPQQGQIAVAAGTVYFADNNSQVSAILSVK